MKTFTNLAHWASKCASLGTINKKRYYLFFITMLLTLSTSTAWGAEVTISYKDIPDGYTATTGTSGSFTKTVSSTNDLTISYAGINTKSKATAAAHAYGYAMFLKNYGYIYSSSAPSGFYPSKVVVKFGSQTGTSGKAGISFGTNVLSTRNSNVTGAVSKSGTCSLENSDKTKLHWNFSTTSANVQVASVTVTYTSIGADETTYSVTLNQPAEGGTIEADKDEAAKGATVTLTATPDEGYNFGAWTVTGASGNVTVTNNQFTMPAEDVTVTASFVAKTQYTIKWNVAEGNVADTQVYEGDALVTLPTAPNCSAGKVFIGWTAATSVNPDGSGITYVKATDVPNGDKEYNAVYAAEIKTGGGGATKYVKATTISDGTYLIAATNGSSSYAYTGQVTGKTYGGYTSVTISNDEIETKPTTALEVTVKVTNGKFSMYDGTSYLYLSSDGNNLNFNATEKTDWILDNGKIKNTAITSSTRYLQFNANSGQERFACYKSTQKDAYLYKQGDGSSISYIDYSLDCEANNDPFLTVTETAFDFGTLAKDETTTKTFTVTGGYLAEDVALTISGTDASFFSVSPATITKADDVEETVTVTYTPTATGDHTATLTIKTGDITKTVDLSGTVLAPGKWALVKNVAELSAGDEIIIASAASNYAIGIAATNNYKGAAITKVGETANTTTDVTILTVEETGIAEAPYAFKTNSKYLYAASSSANQLKAQATNNANGQWAVTITAEGVASIVAAKSSNRNVMQCNPNGGSPIFACYESASASYEALAIYRNSENVAKPIISGEANFVGSTQVTITAKSGLTVYYTTDESTPDKTATQYNAPFTISATTTVKAIAYDATDNASAVAEMTFTKQELVSVAAAMALVKDEIAYFDEFEVVKVVAGKGNIYIKDASGHGLIYDNTLAGQLKDGDRVQGFVGISSPYNGLPEAKPYNVTYADLTITAGTAAEPYDFTSTVIAETDINKYIVFQDVEVTANTDMSSNPTLTIGGNNVKFYNQFGVSKTLEAGKIYDIYGFVAVYEKDGNRTLQVYFYEAVQDGEVIQKYTVTYNAGGATGTVPVDNAEYSEGAEVYLKSATGLTYEGYEYKGWKVTDANGTEIPVASNKFNMPASNVTVTAQWEEIVVAPRQDFSAGIWVRVTNADELATDDYVVVAAANLDVAMKSYESGNYCTHMTITKYGSTFLQWDENVGVFQLAKNDDNYTIQDVNTKQYLYAAGSGNNNYLKAANEIPTDADEVKKYIWTITIEDGVTTVKATSENRNTLKYNKNSGQERFSCYASGQEEIALYKYVAAYTRTVTNGNYGTICLPYASSSYSGAEFYEVSWLQKNGETPVNLYLDQLEADAQLEAGKPYIFRATSTELTVTCTGDAVADPTDGANGLTGSFDAIPAGSVLTGNYVVAQNKFWTATADAYAAANRAYIDASVVPDSEQKQIPGRRRVALGTSGENAETGIDNIITTDAPVKVIENGQLIIIRDGVKYNVQGQKL